MPEKVFKSLFQALATDIGLEYWEYHLSSCTPHFFSKIPKESTVYHQRLTTEQEKKKKTSERRSLNISVSKITLCFFCSPNRSNLQEGWISPQLIAAWGENSFHFSHTQSMCWNATIPHYFTLPNPQAKFGICWVLMRRHFLVLCKQITFLVRPIQ